MRSLAEARPAILVEGLEREYAGARDDTAVMALAGLDLEIPQGEVHGLLGPNGAGKTTLCRILATILTPTRGQARIAGYDVVQDMHEVRAKIGIVLGGDRGFYGRLSARQNLRFWATLARVPTRIGRRRTDELLERVGLADRADSRVETFSRGMRQRLHLARALVGSPSVLLLDEPTYGLDPVAARSVRSLIKELRAEGRTLLVTTHDMVEAEAVCDRVSLMDHGRVLRTENPRTIGSWLKDVDEVVLGGLDPTAVQVLRNMDGVAEVSDDGGEQRIRATTPHAARAAVVEGLRLGASTVQMSPPTLEQVYLQVYGDRELRL